MAGRIRVATFISSIAVVAVLIISLVLLGEGVALVGSRDTIILSGNPLIRVSVGIISIFCGVALAILSLRKLTKRS